MIHELRIYECVPGKLPALHQRFETTTLDDLGDSPEASR